MIPKRSDHFPPQIYSFFHAVDDEIRTDGFDEVFRVLDCGAGGPRPPLALFVENGWKAVGVDIDPDRVELARKVGLKRGLQLDVRVGDMRALPFEEESFHAVYEYYSLCHLSREDHVAAIEEMMRVLRPGGLCFLGFMGRESWPLFGKEQQPGEILFDESGKDVLHSIFKRNEPDPFFDSWEILRKDTVIQRRLHCWRDTSREEWDALYDPARIDINPHAWSRAYDERLDRVNYTHTFYTVLKT